MIEISAKPIRTYSNMLARLVLTLGMISTGVMHPIQAQDRFKVIHDRAITGIGLYEFPKGQYWESASYSKDGLLRGNISKYNGSGELVSGFNFGWPNTTTYADVILVYEESMVLLGPYVDSVFKYILYRTNHNGDSVSLVRYYSSPLNASHRITANWMVENRYGGYLIMGASSPELNGPFYQVDHNGSIEWIKDFRRNTREVLWYGFPTSDGGVVMCGKTYPEPGSNGDEDFYIIKSDSLGSILWDTVYWDPNLNWNNSIPYESCHGGIELSNGDLVFTGIENRGRPYYGLILRTDANGNKKWLKVFHKEWDGSTVKGPFEVKNGLMVAGIRETKVGSQYVTDIVIDKLDDSGNKIWEQVIGDNEHNEVVYEAIQTSDGGILMTGFIEDAFTGANKRVLTLKLDACGCLVEGCNPNCSTIGIDDNTYASPYLTELGPIYPNPAAERVTIGYHLPPGDIGSLRIMDLKGQVKHEQSIRSTPQHQLSLDLDTWSSGFYLTELENHTTGQIVRHKLFIQQ